MNFLHIYPNLSMTTSIVCGLIIFWIVYVLVNLLINTVRK